MKRILSLIAVLLTTFIYAQTTVTGTVVADDNTPIPGANIVFDATTGTVSNFDGDFTIVVNASPPFDLNVSSIGFELIFNNGLGVFFVILPNLFPNPPAITSAFLSIWLECSNRTDKILFSLFKTTIPTPLLSGKFLYFSFILAV